MPTAACQICNSLCTDNVPSCSAASSSSSVWIVFDGPLLLQHNSKSVDDCIRKYSYISGNISTFPWEWANTTQLQLEGAASGVQAANTSLLFNGPVQLLGNTQRAFAVANSTAIFNGAVAAADNLGGVMTFKKSAANFKGRLTCSQHA